MRLVVATVGKPRDRALAQAATEYETRARRYWDLTVRHVREEPSRTTTPALVIEREGTRLLEAASPGYLLVACTPGGRPMTSEAFAEWLGAQRDQARDVAFAIGGAFGLSRDLMSRAGMSLSLAPWTLPHELAWLVLVEQIYRAGTILRGEPYHK